MSALHNFVRRLNVMDLSTPRVLVGVQNAVRVVGKPEIGTAARWGLALGLTAFWFIEPYDWIRSLREAPANEQK